MNRPSNGGPGGDEGARTPIPGEEARQGSIILRTPRRRAIFIGGLVAIVLLGLILALI